MGWFKRLKDRIRQKFPGVFPKYTERKHQQAFEELERVEALKNAADIDQGEDDEVSFIHALNIKEELSSAVDSEVDMVDTVEEIETSTVSLSDVADIEQGAGMVYFMHIHALNIKEDC